MQIRKATLHDVKAFVEFRHQSAKESQYLNDITEERAETMFKEYLADEKRPFYLYLDGRNVVGQLFVQIQGKPATLFINLISLLEEYQGRGYAKKLMETAFKEAEAHRCYFVELIVDIENDRAKQFYKKMGFKFKDFYNKKRERWVKEMLVPKTNNVAKESLPFFSW